MLSVAVVNGHEPAVVGKEPLALAGTSVVNPAGGVLHAYHGDLLVRPLERYQRRNTRPAAIPTAGLTCLIASTGRRPR